MEHANHLLTGYPWNPFEQVDSDHPADNKISINNDKQIIIDITDTAQQPPKPALLQCSSSSGCYVPSCNTAARIIFTLSLLSGVGACKVQSDSAVGPILLFIAYMSFWLGVPQKNC